MTRSPRSQNVSAPFVNISGPRRDPARGRPTQWRAGRDWPTFAVDSCQAIAMTQSSGSHEALPLHGLDEAQAEAVATATEEPTPGGGCLGSLWPRPSFQPNPTDSSERRRFGDALRPP